MKTECKVCGSDKTKLITKTETFKYNNHKIKIYNYSMTHCKNCGEFIPTTKSRNKSIPIIKKAIKTINKKLSK